MSPESQPHTHQQTVAPEDIDGLGHVNHATYLVYFERARWDFLKPLGVTMASVQASGLGPVILEARIKYQRELRPGASFLVRTVAERKNDKIGLIHQSMHSADGQTQHAELELSFGLMDLNQRRLVPFGGAWSQL